jgi:lipoate-protein ligase A
MQQGSLILGGDITKIREALWVDQPGQRLAVALRMRYRATTLENGLGRRVELGEVTAALQRGFAEALNVELVEGGLTEKEMARAGELRDAKYDTEQWTKVV